jgi:hypothetical protein
MPATNNHIPSDLLHINTDAIPFLFLRRPRMSSFFSNECRVPDPYTSPEDSQEDSQQNQAANSSKSDAKTQNQSSASGH